MTSPDFKNHVKYLWFGVGIYLLSNDTCVLCMFYNMYIYCLFLHINYICMYIFESFVSIIAVIQWFQVTLAYLVWYRFSRASVPWSFVLPTGRPHGVLLCWVSECRRWRLQQCFHRWPLLVVCILMWCVFLPFATLMPTQWSPPRVFFQWWTAMPSPMAHLHRQPTAVASHRPTAQGPWTCTAQVKTV